MVYKKGIRGMISTEKVETLKYAKVRLLRLKIKLLQELIMEVEKADYSNMTDEDFKKEYTKARVNYHYISKKRDNSKEIRIKY